MKSVLVTGAGGQLGMAIQRLEGHYPDLSFSFKDRAALNITRKEQVVAVFAEGRFDYCINCAAYTNVEQAEQDPEPAFEINAHGAGIIAGACAEYGVVLIHISTDYVFDGEKTKPYTTKDTPNPINVYGKSKLQGEELIMGQLEKFYIIRTSWLYSDFGENFYTKILQKAKEQDVLHITREQTGCPTHADNLARYILKIVSGENEYYGIHHFTDGVAMTWYDFAREIVSQNSLQDRVRVVEAENYRTFARRPKNSVLMSDK